jgi:hypothetical protein
MNIIEDSALKGSAIHNSLESLQLDKSQLPRQADLTANDLNRDCRHDCLAMAQGMRLWAEFGGCK